MDKRVISNKQGICMMVLFIIGSSLVVGIGSEAKQDAWISIIAALLISLPMLIVYSRLLNLFPGKDLHEILFEVFGKIFGRIVSLTYVWFSFLLGALVIRNFTEFVNVMAFPETPQFIIVIFFGLTGIWAVKCGIEVLGRFSVFIFVIILLSITLNLILSATNIHPINLRPVLYDGIRPVLSSAFSLFSFPFAEAVVLTMAFHSLRNNKKTFSVFFSGVVIGGIILLLVNIRNILVLGVPVATSLYFPSYVAVRTINIGDFLQRFEATVAITFMLAGFVKICVCLYTACTGFAKIFNISDYRRIVAPIGFLAMNLACIVFGNTMDMFNWALKIYPYYAFPFQVIMPLITLIAAKIKIGSGKRRQNA